MIQETSRQAYEDIQPEIKTRQKQVYDQLKEFICATNTMLSKKLNLPINTITPRIHELRKLKLVGVARKDKCPITNKRVIWWKCVHSLIRPGRIDSDEFSKESSFLPDKLNNRRLK